MRDNTALDNARYLAECIDSGSPDDRTIPTALEAIALALIAIAEKMPEKHDA